jgi:hypothetical protein
MPSPSAVFDFIFLTARLEARLGCATTGEIHLFSYLGCLLSLFNGFPVAEWGYSFTGLEAGAPFSPELQEANDQLLSSGMIAPMKIGFCLSKVGTGELDLLTSFELFASRKDSLDAACSSLLAFPVGFVRSAMSMEPGLRPVLKTGGTRRLLAEAPLSKLYEQFEALNQAVGRTSDLLVPATVWLTYLAELSRDKDRALFHPENSKVK